MLGEQGSRVLKFETNGQFRDFTRAAGLQNLKARDGILADLDFTGKLDLLTVLPDGGGLRVYRNLGNFYFTDKETNSGLPLTWPGVARMSRRRIGTTKDCREFLSRETATRQLTLPNNAPERL